MDTPNRVAVIMACHDRRETTLRCLEALATQNGLPDELSIQVFLLDDASRDGTADAVRTRYPEVRVIQGDGHRYWAGGMRQAWEVAARESRILAFFWLNDDTVLDPDALACFVIHHREQDLDTRPGILVGATRDPDIGRYSYSGLGFSDPRDPLKLRKLAPNGTLQPCVSFNGNAVWIPIRAFEILGGMDPIFMQGLGDWDYGLRAYHAGIPQWILPQEIASCSPNIGQRSWHAGGLSLLERYRHLSAPKGLPPKIWFTYCRRHGRWHWMLEACRPYLGVLRIHLMEKLRHVRAMDFMK